MGELDTRFTCNGMFKWRGTLQKDRKVTLWSNCTSNRYVFHAHIFSSSQVPVHSDFGRELLKWEACVTLSVLSSKQKQQQYASVIHRYC